jgi:hypothetical protein
MPEGVPADLSNACSHSRWLQLPVKNALLSTRSARIVSEHKIFLFGIGSAIAQLLQRCYEPGINGKRAEGCLSLGVTDPPVDNPSLDHDAEILPVEVTPLQAHDFADPQTETSRNQNHSVVWLGIIAPAVGESAPQSKHEVCPCARRSGAPNQLDWHRSVPIAVRIDRGDEAGFGYGPYFSEPAEATVTTVRPALGLSSSNRDSRGCS